MVWFPRWLLPVLLLPVLARADMLDRTPQNYLILGMRGVHTKNLVIAEPGCNVGVNCAPAGQEPRSCGRMTVTGGTFPAPGQVAANRLCDTRHSSVFFQAFNNLPVPCVPPAALPFTPPILGDLDLDGQPSCSGTCTVDLGDLTVACGLPGDFAFPPCSGPTVVVPQNGDCTAGDAPATASATSSRGATGSC